MIVIVHVLLLYRSFGLLTMAGVAKVPIEQEAVRWIQYPQLLEAQCLSKAEKSMKVVFMHKRH